MKVIVLGNGFDLGIGLPTSYSDFMKSTYFTDHFQNGLFHHFHQAQHIKGWVDFEEEIYQYSISEPDPTRFMKELEQLCTSFHEYLESLDLHSIDQHSYAYNYIYELFYNSHRKAVLIINFNFSNSVQWIFDHLRYNYSAMVNAKMDIIHVHGSVKSKNMIFGVDDSLEIPEKYHFIKKSANRNYKPHNIHQILASTTELQCYGLSLGKSDHTYFRDYIDLFLKDSSNRRFKIYNMHDSYRHMHYQLDTLTNNNLSKLTGSTNYSFIAVDRE